MVVGLIVLLAVIGAVIGGNKSTTTSSNSDANHQESSTAQQQPTVKHSNGYTIVGGIGYRIDSLSHPTSLSSFGEEKEPGGEFIVLHISVENVGQKGADLSSSDFHLRSNGTQFDADNGITVEGEFFLEKLNPGTRKSGVVVFDVPANTSPHKYALEVFGNGAEGSADSTLIPL